MNRIKQNYHWVIALLVFLEMFLYGGFLNCISIFTVPMSEALGITRSSYSISQIFRNCSGVLGTLLVGVTYQRLGYRKSGILLLILSAAMIVVIGLSQSLSVTCVAYGVYGFTAGILSTTGAVRIVKDWFHKHQGTVLGIVTMATGLGGSVLNKVLTAIITQYNWRYAHFFAAAIFLCMALLFLFLRNRPSEMGLKPYGLDTSSGKMQTADPAHTEWAGHSFQELLRTPQFYLMAVCIFLSCLCVYISFSVIVPHFQDRGYSVNEASNFYSVMLIMLSFAKLFGGWLSDRIGAKNVAILTILAAACGQWLLANPQNSTTAYLGVMLLSMGLLVATITAPLVTMPLFGYRAFGSITSIFMAMISLGSMLATPLANLAHDYLGSYTPAFQAAAIMDLALIVLFLILFFLCDREKKKYLAAADPS